MTMFMNSQIPVRMEYTHTTSVKATSLGIVHLVIKTRAIPWFNKKAVALIGLIRLIYYLFTSPTGDEVLLFSKVSRTVATRVIPGS